MIVRYSESLQLDPDRRNDVVAFAGFLGCYQHGMRMRDAVKSIMSIRGTGWLKELEEKYPRGTDYDRPKSKRASTKKSDTANGK